MALPPSLPSLTYVYNYPDFESEPDFDHYTTGYLGWYPAYTGIGGQPFYRNTAWERYCKLLDKVLNEYWPIDLHTRFKFKFEATGGIFQIAFLNANTVGASPYTNCFGVRFEKDAAANKWAVTILFYDDTGTSHSVTAGATATMLTDTFYRLHLSYDPVSRGFNLRVTHDNGYTNVTQFGGTLGAAASFQLDAMGVFNHFDAGAGTVNAYFTELFAVDYFAYPIPPSLSRKITASIVHEPVHDGSMARDLIAIGTARGTWHRRQNSPSRFTIELLNVNNRHSVRFSVGDIIRFYLGRDGQLESLAVFWGKIKGDLGISKTPKKCRVDFTAFGLVQASSDQGVYLWSRPDAPYLTKGYTYDGSYNDNTSSWNLDDGSLADFGNAVGETTYFASGVKFNGVRYEILNTTINRVVVWEYWDLDAQAWAALDVYIDDGNHFRNKNANNTFWHMPHNWGTTKISTDTIERYWVRARVTTAGNVAPHADFVKILNDYDGQSVEFAITDMVDSLYGQWLKTNFVMNTSPTVLIPSGLLSSDGGSILEIIKLLTAKAFISRYPYGSPLPYYFSQRDDEFEWMPTKDIAGGATYVDLVMGGNLKSISAVYQLDKMANEVIEKGDNNVFGTVLARGSVRKYGFIKTGAAGVAGDDTEGNLRDAAIKTAQQTQNPYVPIVAKVIGLFTIPIGAIVSVSGADEYDGKYVVKESYGDFDSASVNHFLVLGDKQTTLLEAIDGT